MMDDFILEIDEKSGGLRALYMAGDADALNWVEGNGVFGTPYGEAIFKAFEKLPDGWTAEYQAGNIRIFARYVVLEKGLKARYVFENRTGSALDIMPGALGIRTCLNDNYEKAEECLHKRCHMHIWCGGDTAYIYACRMNGASRNLGLILSEGSVFDYAVERAENSNDRGDISLLLPAMRMEAGASYTLEFVLKEVADKADFYRQACKTPQFARVWAERYALSCGEAVEIFVQTKDMSDPIQVYDGEKLLSGVLEGGIYRLTHRFEETGERKLRICYGKQETYIEFLIYQSRLAVIDRRIEFLIDRQQCHDTASKFHGAFFLYDREENKTFVENKRINDRNIARERSGMTASLLLRALQEPKACGQKLRAAIEEAMEFIDREIVSPKGHVGEMPRYKRYRLYDRKYNYSWYMLLYSLMYAWTQESYYLKKAYKIAKYYYKKGGDHFYAINLPLFSLWKQAVEAGEDAMANDMKEMFLRHGDHVVEKGVYYPPHEVKYEQSIVAPSVDILLNCYEISGSRKYLDEAERQLVLLEAFNGDQPSFHLNDIAIRHWDGFWFGKRKQYGDTFPHYWSQISAMVFYRYGKLAGKPAYIQRAKNITDQNLCLYDSEGFGSCAYLYPLVINGNPGKYYDPWANDQDWSLYFNLLVHAE